MLDEITGPHGATRVNGALTDARRLLADTEAALRDRTLDAGAVSAAVSGTHEVISALTGLVQALMDHTPALVDRHGPDISTEVLADLRALHGCLTTGALLLAPTLEDLHVTGTEVPTPAG
nr:hypothetical protein [Kibdelosporangium sp. MJ126-NF4]CEL17373.1 hypothetical protein [Kibdelosporangium sp. MJ126-NF4]CTQ91400.1 hypothetical protein [Kibdelosporangium sp. MJ126-NF4]